MIISKLTFCLFLLSFPMTIFLFIWKQMRRPAMKWKWVFSPLWICVLLMFGEVSFQQNYKGFISVFIVLIVIFFVSKLKKKEKWEGGWVLYLIWFWAIAFLGGILHLGSIQYLEPRGLPF